MILLIDNYDSFVYNLARYIGMLGHERVVVRNDAVDMHGLVEHPPEAIIISPGPCTPSEAGASNEIIRKFGNIIPILGVCLGHQCIGDVYGASILRAPKPVHGKASSIRHNGVGLFKGLPNPFMAGRYHSLIVDVPANIDLEITAKTEDDVVMAFHHKIYPVYGIQFHPESCLTEHGIDILQNFLFLADEWNEKKQRIAA